MATAYLVLEMRANDGPFLEFCGVSIKSDPTGCYNGNFSSVVLKIEDEDYQKAHDRVLNLVMNDEFFSFARPWLAPELDAHKARFWVYELNVLLSKATIALSRLAGVLFNRPEKEDPITRSAIIYAQQAFEEATIYVNDFVTANLVSEDERVRGENKPGPKAETATE